ncbi:MAG: iron-containing alcohol dehydrogenase family protein [Candidatus Sericytochromatia bacterium]|nr:iron-containing alcohol dehydrogenase family protein [Candidatus Tanganyikabacteria bacterium]
MEQPGRRPGSKLPPESRSLAPGPTRVHTGPEALDRLARQVADEGDRVLVVSGPTSWGVARDAVVGAFDRAGLALEVASYGEQITEAAIERLCVAARGMDAIVGVGGGRALDAAKLVAHHLGLPAFTVPTSAATCAAWTALSNLYSPAGGWLGGVTLDRGPAGAAISYALVETAGPRLLASGVADAMAKWYESETAVDLAAADALTAAAVEMAHHLHRQLVRHAAGAVADARRGKSSDALRRVIDVNIALAGIVGGLGGSKCRSVAAHAVANGLTHLPGNSASFHGEKVAFGILVQLILLDRPLDEIEELISFFADLDVPVTLAQLLGPDTSPDLAEAARIALARDSGIHRLDVPLDSVALVRAITEADALGRRHLQARRLERALSPIDLGQFA